MLLIIRRNNLLVDEVFKSVPPSACIKDNISHRMEVASILMDLIVGVEWT